MLRRRPMASLKDKLHGQGGETLVEVLAAVLVSSLALLMLAMAVSVSANLSSRSGEAAERYYAATDALATGVASSDGGTGSGTVAVHAKSGGFSDDDVAVEYIEESLPGGETGVAYEQAG